MNVYASILFQRLFNHEISHLIEHFTLSLTTEISAEEKDEIRKFCDKLKPIEIGTLSESLTVLQQDPDYFLNKSSLALDPVMSQKILTFEEYAYLFIRAVIKINTDRKATLGTLMFTKDDELAVEFVTAAANLRSYNFAIGMESLFKIKEMAGKIVPAISSSNALVAAL